MISLGGVAKTGSLVEVAPGFRPFAYVEMRTRRRGAQAARRPPLNTWLVSWWLPAAIRSVKASAFAEGSVPAWLPALRGVPLLGRALDGGAAAITERRFFVNRYGPATPGRPRLSFTYYELVDFAAFPGAVAALLALARDFRARTGWAPGALAVYFVRRGGNKETSNYAGPKGISCTLDPVTVRGTEVFGFFFSRSLSFLSFFFPFFQRLASFFFSFFQRLSPLLTRNPLSLTAPSSSSFSLPLSPGSPRRPALPPVPRGERRPDPVPRRQALPLAVAPECPRRREPRRGGRLRRARPVPCQRGRGGQVRDAVPEEGVRGRREGAGAEEGRDVGGGGRGAKGVGEKERRGEERRGEERRGEEREGRAFLIPFSFCLQVEQAD